MQNEELKQSKAEIAAGLQKYKDLYDLAPVGYFSLDEQGLILESNQTGNALLGQEGSQLSRRRFQLYLAPSSRALFHTFLERTFSGGRMQGCEALLLNPSRSAFWAEVQAIPAVPVGESPRWCRVAVIDIDARKKAEQAQRRIDLLAATNRRLEEEISHRQAVEMGLKESERHTQQLLQQAQDFQKKLHKLSHQILQVQEDQRKEISRELHDKITQLLIGINVNLEVFTVRAARDPRRILRDVVPLRRLVSRSVRVVHEFARELRPAMLDDLGLVPALRSYIKRFPQRKNRKIQFAAVADVEALDNDKKTVLYRVAQEALTNVDRHADARAVKITLSKCNGSICMEVADDGRAFDVNALSSANWNGRLGLVGMRERLEMVGGRLSIESAPGAGTTIRAAIPLG